MLILLATAYHCPIHPWSRRIPPEASENSEEAAPCEQCGATGQRSDADFCYRCGVRYQR